jgi:hypothetical protein
MSRARVASFFGCAAWFWLQFLLFTNINAQGHHVIDIYVEIAVYILTLSLFISGSIAMARSRNINLGIAGAFFMSVFFFLVGNFSYVYWSFGSTANFSVSLTRLDAIYFAIGTLTTAGTGNINATSELMRGIQALQMVLDVGLVVVALGVLVARLSSGSDR